MCNLYATISRLTFRKSRSQSKIEGGGVGERLKPAVLKTVRLERVSGVRIPPPPPDCAEVLHSPCSLRISAAGSDARKTPQVRIPPPPPVWARSLLAAGKLRLATLAQDFGWGLRRPQNASSSESLFRHLCIEEP